MSVTTDRIEVRGGTPLEGQIEVSGAKNAALPLLCASLLTAETLELERVPNLADMATLCALLAQHGVALERDFEKRRVTLKAERIDNLVAPYELVASMRASILVLGPLLARMGEAKVSLPGGCAIGSRPVDFHLSAMEALGAHIEIEGGYVLAKAPPGGLRGATIRFDTVSVGATENALLAAVLASGETTIENAAREPEIVNLGELLVSMGAEIEGLGSATLRIKGKASLRGAKGRVVEDRIEAGSYALAAAMSGGRVELKGLQAKNLAALLDKMREAGVEIETQGESLLVDARKGPLEAVDVTTTPFPGFPTDLQAQFMAAMTRARGVSHIRETIFENRFMHAEELRRLGADIRLDGQTARVKGVQRLVGAPVEATDLRASAALIMAGLVAEGVTSVGSLHHLDRGYDDLVGKLAACGADIRRVRGN